MGHHDRPWLEKLDRLLGSGILAAGVTSLAVAAPGPAVVFAAVWGWIDQKNETTSLLRAVLDGVSGKLLALDGFERHRLIAAAHTTIVASSFFEVLSEEAKDLRLLDQDREMLTTGKWREEGQRLFDALYRSDVPIPSATRGFQENLPFVHCWLSDLLLRTRSFVRVLPGNKPLPPDDVLLRKAQERYHTRYLGLAATVPEFFIWASLDEHAATRYAVREVRTEVREAFESQGTALARIERLLSLDLAHHQASERDVATVIARANRGGLAEPVVSPEAHNDGALTVPTVEEIYISPHCRFAEYDRSHSRPASEAWWDEQRFSRDLDLLLAAHLTSPAAFQGPLLLLGHPGAGKSMLTKVLAARLPPTAYTVVRVPLRWVNADATILDQIQAALDLATNRRVQWWEIAQANPRALRVVLLDGLDELLQAASGGRDRRGYLQEIMDFQRTEGLQGFPVAVIITSRTVVADRVLIAEGTPIVKLEDFDEGQVAEWLDRWNRVNEAATAAGHVRTLPLSSVLDHEELAEVVKQPLLLLMLALYAANPTTPPIDAVSSTSSLYRLLLNEFARREAAKSPTPLSEKVIAAAAKKHLWRLTVAAFAMVNRGRQDITDAELGADLIALEERPMEAADVADIGRDLVGRFFFVHRAEALTGNDDAVRRCYEFLHATFGEYLVAAHIVDTLRTLAAMRSLSDRPVDDDLLHALLSHQPLSDRRQILTFAAEVFDELSEPDQEQIAKLLEELASGVRRRHDTGRYTSYRPIPLDRVRQLAAYSLNLVLLRVLLPREAQVPIAAMCGKGDDPRLAWRSTVALWTAGLDPDKLDGVTAALYYQDAFLQAAVGYTRWAPPYREVGLARLAGDEALEMRLRFGLGIHDFSNNPTLVPVDPWDSWEGIMAGWLVPAMFSNDGRFSWSGDDPPNPPYEAVAPIARLTDRLLLLHGHQMDRTFLRGVLRWRLSLDTHLPIDPAVLASVLLIDPEEEQVRIVLPLLDLDRQPHVAVLVSLAAELANHPAAASHPDVRRKLNDAAAVLKQSPFDMNGPQLKMIHDIIKVFRWPDAPTLPDSIRAQSPKPGSPASPSQ
ncbi:ATP-binding protein [Nonomuraea sp. FMUSA5-5]|uniref:ATP-binding protein n=1 Tax=Nonomuraea composti TaxID=2720023 RepID=A0ABX1BSY8_9ACTN|nr:ATP-binding protein [Nonomuraea sp. FMUSA5-5]NJP98421.1 ATP-binding protein [Nonomuraea sp. FMUSA5-5]